MSVYSPLAQGILLTDFYQLTMAQAYFRLGQHERNVQFDHFYRRNPDFDRHQAGYCVNAGLETLLEWMRDAHFGDAEIDYLRGLTSARGEPMFAEDFLGWLRAHGNFGGITLQAIPEGRVVHPNVPLTVVRGPLIMAQILETALLNILNHQTLIATKAARILDAGLGRTLLEFGLRRAQGLGANAGTRAALIGGAHFSSNVGASAAMGTPPKGTHAHSLVQLCVALGMGEEGAFNAYADLYPDDTTLLLDTIDTLGSGLPNAIRVFERLRAAGHKPVGVRLDSGDQAWLALQVARELDTAGFPDVNIVLSSDLDELVIWQILTQIRQEAPRYGVDPEGVIRRLVYGVGTRLITSWGEPALGGVYKLVAVEEDNTWESAIKLSEVPAKTPNPGVKRLWRLYDGRGFATADLLTLEDERPLAGQRLALHHPNDHTKMRVLPEGAVAALEPLHVDVLRAGKLVYDLPPLDAMRAQRIADVERLDTGVRRLVNPHIYHVSVSEPLWDLKQALIASARESMG